jgi:hypothetical protein
MTNSSGAKSGLVPAGSDHPSFLPSRFPAILKRAGKAALFATDEFFFGRIRNEHTRAAYVVAVRRFLVWAESYRLDLLRITPADVEHYMDELRNASTSVATRKQHLAALRHYFDGPVTRHVVILNPAPSVRHLLSGDPTIHYRRWSLCPRASIRRTTRDGHPGCLGRILLSHPRLHQPSTG